MPIWTVQDRDLKRYLHFDKLISSTEATGLVNDRDRVAKHAFLPLLHYEQSWNRWAPAGQQGKPKSRPIRYAARRDAYIYAKYRKELSVHYEEKLLELGLTQTVLAYRKITDPSGRGKCNIDYAYQAFRDIRKLEDCVVVALDVKGFFESLDHEAIKKHWMALLGVNVLPDDHFNVYKSVTNYCYIDKSELYVELGFIGEKIDPKTKKPRIGYLVAKDQMPKGQLCSPSKLRELTNKENPRRLLKFNADEDGKKKTFGVPQGTPLSDLLANAYLLDFDVALKSYADMNNGSYYRYSDDIILILPGAEMEGRAAMEFAQKEIASTGPEMKIKVEKTYVYEFSKSPEGGLKFKKCMGPKKEIPKESQAKKSAMSIGPGTNGFEYLGFRFDGKNIYLRDSTVSNLLRKVTKSSNQFAVASIKRFAEKNLEEVLSYIDVESFIQRFGRVKKFEEVQSDTSKWTFWTYISKCRVVFGDDFSGIEQQIRYQRAYIRGKVEESVNYYFSRVRRVRA